MTKQAFIVLRARRRSAGMGIVTAIFLLVVLAGLGVAMVTVFTTQQATSALDEQGARAYQAARAGVEWGLYRQLQPPGAPCPPAGVKTTFAMPPNTSLAGFSVSVVCQTIEHGQPAAAELSRRVITATACNQPSASGCPNASNHPDYVQRVVEVEI